MENYERLSFAFKKMLKRTKIMRDRLKDLREKINKNTNKLFIKSEQYSEMKLECDGINGSIGYLNIELKRTIIMLKICLYKQRAEKDISITEPNVVIPLVKTLNDTISETTTISSVEQNNDFVRVNNSEEKSASISKCRDSAKQTNQERKKTNTSSIHYSRPPKIIKIATVDSINNKIIGTKFTNQESSEFMDEETTFRGKNESTGSKKSTITGHILILFVFLLTYYKLTESKKIKCKMRRTYSFFLQLSRFDDQKRIIIPLPTEQIIKLSS